MYITKQKTPKEKLAEFGSKKWQENNILFIVLQTMFLYLMAFYLKESAWFNFFIVWASLPFLGLVLFFSSTIAGYASALQSSWWLLVLFWKARNEQI